MSLVACLTHEGELVLLLFDLHIVARDFEVILPSQIELVIVSGTAQKSTLQDSLSVF
jgi:hypothetical protein